MTTTPVEHAADTPARGVVAGAVTFAGHVLVFLAAFVAGRVVKPSGGGFQDLAAVVVTFLGGELLLALASVIVGTVLFKRGWRRTGVGVMGGWLAGILAFAVLRVING